MTNDAVTNVVDTGLLSLCLIARFMGMATSLEQLRRQFVEPKDKAGPAELLRMGKSMGLKTAIVTSKWDKLAKTALPAIVSLKSGDFIILAGVKADQVLLQDPTQNNPKTLSREEFLEIWDGHLILVTKRANLQSDDRKKNSVNLKKLYTLKLRTKIHNAYQNTDL